MALWGVVFFSVVAAAAAEKLAVFPEEVNARFNGGSRIVSGWEAQEGQFPYQFSMRMVNQAGGVNACGGTIIHEEWGLTAAHCTATRVTMVIRVGGVNLTRPYEIFETTEYYNHYLYNSAMPSVVQPNDIALLKFNRRLVFNDRIQPVRLQPSRDMNRNYDGVRLTAAGWGATWTGSAGPEVMNWVFLTGVSNTFCLQQYGGSPIIQPSIICARYYNVTSQSTCSGDSGGSLTEVGEDGRPTQVGISSFVSGQGCHVVIPAGFARPGHYHAWYKNITGIDFDWGQEETTTTEEPTQTTEESTQTTDEEPTQTTEVEPTQTTEEPTQTTEEEPTQTTEVEPTQTTEIEPTQTTEETTQTTEEEPTQTTEVEPTQTTEEPTQTTEEVPTSTTEAPEVSSEEESESSEEQSSEEKENGSDCRSADRADSEEDGDEALRKLFSLYEDDEVETLKKLYNLYDARRLVN